MEKQSAGNKQMQKIDIAFNRYSRHALLAERQKKRLVSLIRSFPKTNKPLFEERLTKIKNKLICKQ